MVFVKKVSMFKGGERKEGREGRKKERKKYISLSEFLPNIVVFPRGKKINKRKNQ